MATFFGRVINQNSFKCHTIFSANFYKINEEIKKDNEIEMCNKLKINQNITEPNINNIYVQSQLQHQIQIQELKNREGLLLKLIR